MSRIEFEILVRQLRYYQKNGNQKLAEKAAAKVDNYLDNKFEPKLQFDEEL